MSIRVQMPIRFTAPALSRDKKWLGDEAPTLMRLKRNQGRSMVDIAERLAEKALNDSYLSIERIAGNDYWEHSWYENARIALRRLDGNDCRIFIPDMRSGKYNATWYYRDHLLHLPDGPEIMASFLQFLLQEQTKVTAQKLAVWSKDQWGARLFRNFDAAI